MRAKPFTLRRAIPGDARWLVPALRERDRLEAEAAAGDNLVGAIFQGIEASPICDVAEIDGRGVFIIGCAPIPDQPRIASPWLLGTDEADRYPGALTKVTKHYVQGFMERWPILLNYVDVRNDPSVRWLQRLGFRMHEPVVFGRGGELFHPFTMGV